MNQGNPKNWKCPFCGHAQAATDVQRHYKLQNISLSKNRFGDVGIQILARCCANDECGEVTLAAIFGTRKYSNDHGGWYLDEEIESYRLRPKSLGKPQPEYIPAVLRADYLEACLIRDLSPKASATLARRCLQGMIRDFCGISRNRLIDEVRELQKLCDAGQAPPGVTLESVAAIDHVREIGNIGAHMERDINIIVAIEPGEAQALIGLVELLFDEWYVARNTRQRRLADLKRLNEQKQVARKGSSAAVEQQLAEDDGQP